MGVLFEKAFSILERKVFGLFGDIFYAGLFEHLFKRPEDDFEEKKYWIEFLVDQPLLDFERNFFVFLTRIFRWGCQNRTLCASEIFFTKHRVLKKYILLKSLSAFIRQFSRFEAKHFWQVYQFCIQFVWRKLSRESFAGSNFFFVVFF